MAVEPWGQVLPWLRLDHCGRSYPFKRSVGYERTVPVPRTIRSVPRSPPGLLTNATPVPSATQPTALVPWNSRISVPAGSLAVTEMTGSGMVCAYSARLSVPESVNGESSLTVATVTPYSWHVSLNFATTFPSALTMSALRLIIVPPVERTPGSATNHLPQISLSHAVHFRALLHTLAVP